MNQPSPLAAIVGAILLTLTAARATAQSGVGDTAGPRVAAASVAMGSRDADGRIVIRAQDLRERMNIDGRLDESLLAVPAGCRIRAG